MLLVAPADPFGVTPIPARRQGGWLALAGALTLVAWPWVGGGGEPQPEPDSGMISSRGGPGDAPRGLPP